MKSRNIFILAVLFSIFCLKTDSVSGEQEPGVFNRANVCYEQSDYDEAIKQYQSILESGWESGNLYYNLGNCYFKKGQLGRAILNYEKARRLIPQDKDLEFNYTHARSLIKGQAVVGRKSLFLRAGSNLFEKFTLDGLAILISAFYILFLAGILAGLFFKRFRRKIFALAAFAGIFFAVGLTGFIGKRALLNKEAVITVEQVDAKFEPMDKATAYFSLYEGMKVEIVSSKDSWYKVRRPDNKSGWVPRASLDKL